MAIGADEMIIILILLLVLNVLMAGIDIYLGWYGLATVCGVTTIGLVGVLILQFFATMRRWEEEVAAAARAWVTLPPSPIGWWQNPQRSLDQCFVCGVCPDCAKESLANFSGGDLMCSEIGCNSRFHRDSEGRWSRK